VKELLKELDKAFENKIRLGIMSALVVNDQLDFTAMKELLGVTDGNLASHLKNLEKSGYVTFRKEFVNRKPRTRYYATPEGREAFARHLQVIEQLLKVNNKP
jgi:DNA-binding MarR family transcriptional regulator